MVTSRIARALRSTSARGGTTSVDGTASRSNTPRKKPVARRPRPSSCSRIEARTASRTPRRYASSRRCCKQAARRCRKPCTKPLSSGFTHGSSAASATHFTASPRATQATSPRFSPSGSALRILTSTSRPSRTLLGLGNSISSFAAMPFAKPTRRTRS